MLFVICYFLSTFLNTFSVFNTSLLEMWVQRYNKYRLSSHALGLNLVKRQKIYT